MSHIGKYVKTPTEVKRYSIDYSEWLDAGEKVSTLTFVITPVDVVTPLVINAINVAIDGLSVTFTVSGGTDGGSYKAVGTMTSTAPQVKDVTVLFIVKAQ